LASAAFTPLESRKQNDAINWYNNLANMLIGYKIGICPFQHIELAYGSVGLCLPGVGMDRYDQMGRDLHTLLASKLLPMQVNNDGSKLAQALALATDASMPNGYDLLHVMLKTLVAAFDDEVLEITWPKYSTFGSILEFATAVEQTVLLASKRQQAVSQKNAVLQFLNGIISEANHDYRLQAQIIKTELNTHQNKTPLPTRFELKKLAFEITNSKPVEGTDLDLAKPPSIYRLTANAGTDTREDHSRDDRDDDGPEHMQGYNEIQYRVNEAVFGKRHGGGRRRNYPVPDPARNLKDRPNKYDATIRCGACGQRGHPATRCFALATAIYVKKFIESKANEETANTALEFWKVRNAPLIRDAETKEGLSKHPMQVLRTYMDKNDMNMETVEKELDWCYFDKGGSESEVFGMGGRTRAGSDESQS
jgi:hypothetical protein